MKYLSQYIKEAQTACFDKQGVFFAFSNDQFNDKKVEGVEYVSLGAGTICPKDNAEDFLKEHSDVVKAGQSQDIAENGKDGVILRELCNHECFYTTDYTGCFDALEGYEDITKEDIIRVYKANYAEQIECI